MKIFQIWYDEHSKSKLSPHFIPYDNRTPDKPNEFEYGVMRKLYYDEKTWHKNKHLGVLSWKFQDKSLVNPHTIKQWVSKNKADVYHINPFPQMPLHFHNVWHQGDSCHHGLTQLTTKLLEESGINTDILTLRHDKKTTCYCNYWIANKKFWDLFMSYTEPLYETIYKSDQAILDRMFNIKADVSINAGMFPFIFERMFSSVLSKHENEFKILPYFT